MWTSRGRHSLTHSRSGGSASRLRSPPNYWLPISRVPSCRLGQNRSKYTCLEKSNGGGLYRFLSLDGGFTADLPVDADGLVLDYPGLFKRVLP